MYYSEILKTSFPLVKYDSLKSTAWCAKTLDSTSKTEVPVYFEQGCIWLLKTLNFVIFTHHYHGNLNNIVFKEMYRSLATIHNPTFRLKIITKFSLKYVQKAFVNILCILVIALFFPLKKQIHVYLVRLYV